MIELIIRSGKHEGKRLIIPESGLLIGRDESCQIRIASTDVSRKHCSLRPTSDGVVVRDLGSRNGTLVNDGVLSSEVLLQPGDLVRIGPMKLEMPGKKKETGPNQGPKFSEDDIASLLSDDINDEDVSGSDTTIIKREERQQKKTSSNTSTAARHAKQFKTIAEEAADIIRRHRIIAEQEQQAE